LFKVLPAEGSEPIIDRLAKIASAPLDQRTRHVGYKLRLEDFRAPDDRRSYWLLDFAKLRFDGGPGRASERAPTASFDLAEGEGFSEETAMLYHPASGFAALQYNHHGPRVQAIADYLGAFDPGQSATYEFRLQLRADAQARLDKKKIFTKLEIKVAPAALSPAFRENNVSLTSMLQQQLGEFGGDTVAITIALERSSANSLRLKNWLPRFKEMADSEHEAVSVLRVVGRDENDGPLDPVDLIAEKERLEYAGLEMDAGLRYLREERWRRLEAAYSTWKTKRVIT